MTLRGTVRHDMCIRLQRTRLLGILQWRIHDDDPDDLTPILDAVFRWLPAIDPTSELVATSGRVADMDLALAAGQVLLWRAVREGLVLIYDVTADGETYRRRQIAKAVDALLASAEHDAGRHGLDVYGVPPVRISSVTYASPYDADDTLIYAQRDRRRLS